MAIALTERASIPSLYDMNAGTKERVRLRGLAAFLLLSTFALALHIQSAKYEHPFDFTAHHILHGDLRPDTGKIQAAALAIGAWSATALALLPVLFFAAPVRFFREVELLSRIPIPLLRAISREYFARPRSIAASSNSV
jgi:hypothetical protein